jgi:hypothetical protein
VRRFTPSRIYLLAAASALGLAAFSGWYAQFWLPSAIPAGLFLASAALVLWLATRPVIRITDDCLEIGAQQIEWSLIRRVDQTGWVAPLVAYLTLADGRRIRIVHPGDTRSSNALLRVIQQRATQSLINGVPHRQIFGAPLAPQKTEPLPSPRYQVVSQEEEDEIERMLQKLRTAGRLDPEK